MKVSIVIPVRNQPRCLSMTLASLAAQSAGTEPFEVIVVDDASTDRTAEVAEAARGALDLKMMTNPVNRGRAASRNAGAAIALGDRLLFLDADSYAAPDLVAGHQRWCERGRDDIVMGRRIEIGWWNLEELSRGRAVTEPLAFEEDQRDSRGIGDAEQDFFGRTPWLFAATHNMSMPAEVFRKVGGFDEELTGWGYEDNEFAYRVFCLHRRSAEHFRHDPALVCHHLPHFRDWNHEWENTKPVLQHIKHKHRHFDVEMLAHPPNHLRIAQTLPYYERGLAHLAATTRSELIDAMAGRVPEEPGSQLWLGHGVGALASITSNAEHFDHAQPHGPENPHVFGMHIPRPDASFAATINVDLWRLLNAIDLSALVMEGLRVSDTLVLALSRHIRSVPAERLALISDVDYVIDMLSPRYAVDITHSDNEYVLVRCRPGR